MMMDRKTYIGGADAAAILGKNEYQTVLKTWRKKVGLESDDFDNKHIRRGNTMEAIIEDYCIETFDSDINSHENFVRFGTPEAVANFERWTNDPFTYIKGVPMIAQRPQISVRHKEFDYCGGHPDGLTKKCVWEFKAPAMRNFTYIERQGITESWLIQVQYYMWITGIPQGRVAVWNYDEWEPMIVRMKPNRRLHKLFEELLPAFWFHVETQTEPNFEGMESAFNYVDDEWMDILFREYTRITDQKFDSTDRQKMLKATIMSYLQGAESLTTKNFYVSAKMQKRYGTEFARLIVKPVETDEGKAWREALEEEEARTTISNLVDQHGKQILKPKKEATVKK